MNLRRVFGGCVLFAWLAVLPPSGSAGLLAAQGGAVLREMLRDPLAILSDRSPGERQGGALAQSKQHLATGPTERVLSPVLERPATPIPVNLDNLPARAQEVIDPGSRTNPGVPGGGNGGGSGGGGGGGGSGGGGPPGPNPPGPPTPPVVTPVPEPTTWLMMIAGVALLGLQLRRRSAAHGAAEA
jgi:uncharacterized membrane protein YgcG